MKDFQDRDDQVTLRIAAKGTSLSQISNFTFVNESSASYFSCQYIRQLESLHAFSPSEAAEAHVKPFVLLDFTVAQ